MNLSGGEADFFLNSVLSLHSKGKKEKQQARERLKDLIAKKSFGVIAEPKFSILNEWYYLTLLQTFELRDFQPSVNWVAQKLGIKETEVESALTELTNAELLVRSGSFYEPSKSFVRTDEIPSKKIRNHLQSFMKMASVALETQSIEERDFSSTVCPIDSSQIQELKSLIRDFRESFCQKASSSMQSTEVYNLSIQFFKVSKTT